MSEREISIGKIAHQDFECPAIHKDKADELVPELEANAHRIPRTGAFSTKDHAGVFVAEGSTTEIEGVLEEIDLPLHTFAVKDASHDQRMVARVDGENWINDEAQMRRFVTEAEADYFEDDFPNKDQKIVSFPELAGFIKAQHPEKPVGRFSKRHFGRKS